MRNDKRRERHKKMTELSFHAVLLYLQKGGFTKVTAFSLVSSTISTHFGDFSSTKLREAELNVGKGLC